MDGQRGKHQCILTHSICQIFSDEDKRTLTGTFVVGRIKKIHARKDLFGPTNAIDTGKMLPVSRLGGIGYGRTTDAFGEQRLEFRRIIRVTDNWILECMRPSWSDYEKQRQAEESEQLKANGSSPSQL